MRSPNPRSNSLEAQRYYSGASRTTMAGGLGAAVSSPLQNRGGLNRSGSMAGNLQPSKGATPNPNRPHAYHHHGMGGTTMQQNQKKDAAARKTMSNSQAFKMQEEERAKKPKIVFLDVDGVLHSIRVTRQEQLFNAQKMGLLRRILNASGAQIVLSSAWRRTAPTLRMAYAMLQKHGIATPIDITPDYGLCGKRSAEILTWVDKYQIKDWIAIDDMDLNAGEPRMRPHFIKCNPLVGLTNDLVEQSINILNKHDHQSHSEVDQLVAKALNVHGGAGVAGTNTTTTGGQHDSTSYGNSRSNTGGSNYVGNSTSPNGNGMTGGQLGSNMTGLSGARGVIGSGHAGLSAGLKGARMGVAGGGMRA